jgi:3-hydroxyisobutyrate dehydrogenase
MKIGFIGLGRMGNHMARHLAQKGHEVAAFDVRPEAVTEQAKIPGTRAATSVADAARDADIVFTSLPGPVEVEQIVSGEGGLMGAMKPGSLYVDLSSNSPNLVRRLHGELKAAGIDMLDAPVSGGVGGAEAGTLSVMVGGDKSLFDKVKPVLMCIGSEEKLFHCGDIGAGDVTKLCNNISGISGAVMMAEVLTLGMKAGVDLKTLADVIGVSTGTTRWLTANFPRGVFKRAFTPAMFSAYLSAKDTRLAIELAHEMGVPMALGEQVHAEMQEVLEKGWGEMNFDVVVRLQEEKTGQVLELDD